MKNKELAEKIIRMAKLDQIARKNFIKNASWQEKVKKIDEKNLKEIWLAKYQFSRQDCFKRSLASGSTCGF